MRLAVGLGRADQLEPYAAAGADEMFFGYVPEKWMRRWGLLLPLNRRESRYVNVQAGGMNEVRILKKRAEDRGIPLAVTLNALYYVPGQLMAAQELVLRLLEEGLDTLIVGDLGLLWALSDRGVLKDVRVHLSGEAGEVNRGMLPMLGEERVERIIFHRKTAHADRKGLIACAGAHPEWGVREFEAFVQNERCLYTGAYCTCAHLEEAPPLCRAEGRLAPVREGGPVPRLRAGAAENVQEDGCALCALVRLRREGITHVKLVGRGAHTEEMTDKILRTKRALRLAEEADGEESYLAGLRRMLGRERCGGGCYYPEWGFLRGRKGDP